MENIKNIDDIKIYPEPELEIEIVIKKYGEVVGKRVSYSFEGAEEDLGKLERAYKNQVNIDELPEKF